MEQGTLIVVDGKKLFGLELIHTFPFASPSISTIHFLDFSAINTIISSMVHPSYQTRKRPPWSPHLYFVDVTILRCVACFLSNR